jgi:uncharacterized protein with FMN-binding domain
MKAFLIVIGIIAVFAGVIALFMFYGMGQIRRLVIRGVDLSKIDDGTYEGQYHKGRWTYDVQVTVKDHRIVDVKNMNKMMEMAKEVNAKATAEIVKNQSPVIDVVSGATIFTRAFQKAVENALNSSVKK